MSKRLIARQKARGILLEVFPEPQFRGRIKAFLFRTFGDKFQPDVGEVVAAWNQVPDLFFGRFESGGNGSYMVEGVEYANIRKLHPGEL